MIMDNVALSLLLALGDTSEGGTYEDAREALRELEVSESKIDRFIESASAMQRRHRALRTSPCAN